MGAGAIGSLLATVLADDAHQIILINRNHSDKFKIKRQYQDITNTYEFDGFDQTATISHLLICTKAQDVVTALQSLTKYLSPETRIIDLANGMGHQQQLADIFTSNEILCGSISYGAYWHNDELIYAGRGSIYIGAFSSDPLIKRSQLPELFSWSDNIAERLWTKLAINCAINPLTVLYHCSNGQLLHIPEAIELIDAICTEVEQVANSAGIQLTNTREAALEVIRQTAKNQSSTLQDFLNGKALELDYINGYIVSKARRLELETPVNQQVLQKISRLVN